MAKGRILNKKISFDERVAKLSLEATLLFTWCIPHLDCEGRLYAEPEILKGMVTPFIKELTTQKIEKCIKEIAEVGLIILYGDGHKYMQFKGFNNNQSIIKNREAPSTIPTPDLIGINSSNNLAKCNVMERKGKDDEETTQIFFSYFILKTKKDFKLTEACQDLIKKRLSEGYTLEQLKKAVDNFVLDDWPERQNRLDLIYCIGKQKGKPDALEHWINWKPKTQFIKP